MYGVALFTAPANPHDSGIMACSPESVSELDGWQELDQEIIWLTNIELPVLMESGLAAETYLRARNYMAPDLKQIARELNLDINQSQLTANSIRILQEVAQRIFNYLERLCGMAVSARYEITLDRLTSTIRKAIRSSDSEVHMPQLMHEVFDSAQTLSTRPAVNAINPGDQIITLSYPRGAYAMLLFEQIIPKGAWHFIKAPEALAKVNSDNGMDIIESIFDGRAGFIQVRMNSKRNQDLPFLRAQTEGSQWVSLHEFRELANDISMRVLNIAHSESQQTVGEYLQSANIKLPDMVDGLSYSAGIALENVWKALLLHNESNLSLKPFLDSASVSIRSWDRIFCKRAAEAVFDRGYKVLTHGNNNITVAVPKTEITALKDLGYQLYMHAPTEHLPVNEMALAHHNEDEARYAQFNI